GLPESRSIVLGKINQSGDKRTVRQTHFVSKRFGGPQLAKAQVAKSRVKAVRISLITAASVDCLRQAIQFLQGRLQIASPVRLVNQKVLYPDRATGNALHDLWSD